MGRDLAAAAGAALVVLAAWSVVGTLIVPRRVHSTLTRLVSGAVRRTFSFLADRCATYEARDRVLATQGPIQLVFQVVVWLAAFEVGFALLLWPFTATAGFLGALAETGSSLFTLGSVRASGVAPSALDDLAALAGLATVALQIGYLPTLYGAFNRREGLVARLEFRAGVPAWGPELLARTHYGLGSGTSALDRLPAWFDEWEAWSSDVAESHATYPVLVSFRSPHPYASWVTAQLAVLDAAALYLSLLAAPASPVSARLCLRAGFTCLATVARAQGIAVVEEADPEAGISLGFEDFRDAVARLSDVGFPVERDLSQAWADFVGWRVNYEGAALALAERIDAPPALWSGRRRRPTEPMAPVRPATRRLAPRGRRATER